VERYEYDVCGEVTIFDGSYVTQTTSAIDNPYLFTARRFDPESGNYYYRARVYSPDLGRFLSLDPLGFDSGDYNLYRYVENNPLNLTDPSGNCASGLVIDTLACIAGLGAAVGFISNYVSQVNANLEQGMDIWNAGYAPNLDGDELLNATLNGGTLGLLNLIETYDCVADLYSDMYADLTDNRATDDHPFDNSSWLARYDLTDWLVNQMKVNATSQVAHTLREALHSGPGGFVAATAGWYAMVDGGQPWDFKPDIQDHLNRGTSLILADTWYYFDVAANIHYGYVGRAIGFDREILLFGPGIAQIKDGTSNINWGPWYFDDPRDYTAVQVGMDLFDNYGYNISPKHLAAALDARKSLLHQVVALVPP
jgi:RHS repeat-associated protein